MTKMLGIALAGAVSLAAMAVTSSANAQTYAFEERCSGVWNNFLSNPECRSYVGGIIAGILVSPHAYICVPPNWDRHQGPPMVQNWLVHHPRMMTWDIAHLTRQALRERFPCGGMIPPINR